MPYLEVVIDEKLQFTIIVLGGCYQIVMHYMKTILDRYKQWLSNLIREIMNHELCPGLPLEPKDTQGDKVIITCYTLSYWFEKSAAFTGLNENV